MEFILRPPLPRDAADINAMRRMEGVMENILGMPGETVAKAESFINNIDDNLYMFVAECDGKVVACGNLQVKQGRQRHVGGIGLMVHKDYQGKGIGRAVLEKLLDTADNWLMLKRVELAVYMDNQRAINLYESVGFEREGIKKANAIRAGQYIDEIIMGRIR